MLETKYTCDACGLAIDGKTTPEEGAFVLAGSKSLCVLKHYHGVCFGRVVDAINSVK